MKKLLLLLMAMPLWVQAQKTYSFISDRKFLDPTDLIGYNFRPSKMEIKDVKTQDINPGDFSFGITQSNLYVDGGDIKGVYSVNNINTTEFGFKLLLMNARDPTLQGHLKIILNKSSQVELLVFKRSNKDKEIIFYQKEISENQAKQENKYFTDRNELIIAHPDSLWKRKVVPFFIINNDSKIQTRVNGSDSCSIRFEEIVTIIDKTKKKDKDKEKDKVAAKTSDTPEATKETGKEEVAATPAVSPDAKKAADAKKDIKIIKEHFMYVRTQVKNDGGAIEDKIIKYEVKNVVEKQDKSVGPDGDRYQITISTNKGDIYMYLTASHAVNSVEVAEKSFLVRNY
jgi:hypothetical protein